MKKLRTCSLIIIFCMVLGLFSGALAAENADGLELPALSARNVILADLDSGRLLCDVNSRDRAYPASLTKIMTVLLAVEAVEAGEVSLTDEITAYADCRFDLTDDSSTASIVPGEIMTLEQLMYCALVASANEACNIIGEYLSGSISEFVNRMNERAAELGCTGTHFENPHGLPDDDHYSTAYDIYLISREAMKHELFETIANTQSYTVPATNVTDERVLYNSNALISGRGTYGGGYIYEYASGVKTGYTEAAGYCLVSTAERNDVRVMCIVLGSGHETREDGSTQFNNFVDTVALYNWVFGNYSYYTAFSVSEPIAEVEIEYAPSDSPTVTVRPAEEITVLVPEGTDTASFEKIFEYDEGALVAPVRAGDELGSVRLIIGGREYGSTRLLAATDAQLSRSAQIEDTVHAVFGQLWVKIVLFLIILVIAIYVGLVIRYHVLRERRRREKARRRVELERRREEEARAQVFKTEGRRMKKYDGKNPVARDDFEEFFRNEDK